jgi:hypothetical protein
MVDGSMIALLPSTLYIYLFSAALYLRSKGWVNADCWTFIDTMAMLIYTALVWHGSRQGHTHST